ncbi:hypothetical protein RB653_002931 [Dictyostelium firmibasis]|uniref:EngB-type G domain-containing protein n=1 Tax=Dictyostelium firmibasis TaxID=79012 RepID=A0AAN7UAR0_9MYCE
MLNLLFKQTNFLNKITQNVQNNTKQSILREKVKKRRNEIENTDLKTLPKSDLVYGQTNEDLKRLDFILGQKSAKRIKESTRAGWHERHQNKSSKQSYTELKSKLSQDLINAPLSQTLKIKQKQEYLEKHKNIPNKDPDSKNQIFKNQKFDSTLLEKIKEKKLGKFKQEKPKQGTTKLETVRKEATKDIERFFGSKLKFIGAARSSSSFLPETLPEVAFIGRSNVGKSSLINALTQRGLAKTSSKPGQTQSINWFELGSTLYLVDLPGYGFAFAKEQKLEEWSEITHHYLTERKCISCIFILVDSRHGLKDSDRQLLLELDKNKIKTHIILTKADLTLQGDLVKRIHLVNEEIEKNYHYSALPVLPISSKNFTGISDLSKLIKLMKLKVKPIKTNPNLQPKQILSPQDFELKKQKLLEKKKENLRKLTINKK